MDAHTGSVMNGYKSTQRSKVDFLDVNYNVSLCLFKANFVSKNVSHHLWRTIYTYMYLVHELHDCEKSDSKFLACSFESFQ